MRRGWAISSRFLTTSIRETRPLQRVTSGSVIENLERKEQLDSSSKCAGYLSGL